MTVSEWRKKYSKQKKLQGVNKQFLTAVFGNLEKVFSEIQTTPENQIRNHIKNGRLHVKCECCKAHIGKHKLPLKLTANFRQMGLLLTDIFISMAEEKVFLVFEMEGEKVPFFKLKNEEGKTLTLKCIKGKNIWAQVKM